jgi:hypothetical protein
MQPTSNVYEPVYREKTFFSTQNSYKVLMVFGLFIESLPQWA